jgi:hypothetical protein
MSKDLATRRLKKQQNEIKNILNFIHSSLSESMIGLKQIEKKKKNILEAHIKIQNFYKNTTIKYLIYNCKIFLFYFIF